LAKSFSIAFNKTSVDVSTVLDNRAGERAVQSILTAHIDPVYIGLTCDRYRWAWFRLGAIVRAEACSLVLRANPFSTWKFGNEVFGTSRIVIASFTFIDAEQGT